ncbi:MAG TPA: protein kinase [Candidatus Polarisedimenticolia bacterium]|nr:protein kinase [Candidatus Polarisedimenticolia bacterium]
MMTDGTNVRTRTMRPSAAATLTGKAPTVMPRSRHLFAPGDALASPETGLQYRIERFLGEGGFGQVYLARRLGRSNTVPRTVCIKASLHIDGWLREAYFGRLLDRQPRAIHVYDIFALAHAAAPAGRLLYCLALEYASEGDLGSYLFRTGLGWSEATTRREITGILQVLDRLHRGQMLHRDLTPLNVFVCEGRRLKIGDFGIVRQQSDGRGITARTLNALTAPAEILAGQVPKWQARDDVFQVGQLLAMLIKGDARTRIGRPEVRRLPCSDHLKEIIYRCLGERRKRYESADELIEALRNPPAELKAGAPRTLRGVHLAFTGILDRPRREAARAARRAGAVVHGMPSALTSLVVRGRPNPLQAAGRDGGLKLMEIKRLGEKGHSIRLLDQKHFWRLVGRPPRR